MMRDPNEPWLDITGPDGEQMMIPLTKARLTIGRWPPPANDIALPDPLCLIKREGQCFLEQQGSYWYIGSDGTSRNPTRLSRGGSLCVVQGRVLLTDGSQIYIQGKRTESSDPLFWKCRFRDPEGTQPGQVAPYLAYEWRSHQLFRVVGGVSDVIHLSPHEDRLFQCLWTRNEEHHAPSLVSVADLMHAVWGEEALSHVPPELHRLVSSLREKIELEPDRPRFLCNVRGKGYVLDSFPLPEIPEEDTR
ncbi:MAG TPA: winged helix-turn-helix domain-containing protein [Ktedonobacteraceae bacterium]|nr:winged helix-turn-helix domain-containing protein [Ktedonobacteraceae bacterium]